MTVMVVLRLMFRRQYNQL